MAFINYISKEINAKIVYYGPGLSGKTTNIVFIHKKLKPESRGKLVSLATQTDRTLFFDFLPISLGEINGFKVRFHLYTVPGQIFYNTTRKMVLKGVDGVVFVADSQKQMMEDNIESLKNLEENLKEYGKDLKDIPWVIQYNKRDLPNVLDTEVLHEHLNKTKAPFFTAVATDGAGVLETLMAMCRMSMKKLKESIEAEKREDLTEEDSGRKTDTASFSSIERAAYLPDDYSDEALKFLDIMVGDESSVTEGEPQLEENSDGDEEIEEELKLFEKLQKESGEYAKGRSDKAATEMHSDIMDFCRDVLKNRAIAYDEKREPERFSVEIMNPVIEASDIEIPIKFNFGGKEKSLKIRLKIEFGED